jgi:DNA-binding transcriptional ArsR family regulator
MVLDARSLKGLAHPIRLRLRAELGLHGPATATQLAARIGESSGSTSYHLRQLAAYGFIEEDDTLGHGRERYWRTVHRGVVTEDVGELPGQEFGGEFMHALAQVYAERIIRFANDVEAGAEALGEAWVGSWNMSDWALDLTPDQARELADGFHALCAPYRHEAGQQAPNTSLVRVQFQVLPPAQGDERP